MITAHFGAMQHGRGVAVSTRQIIASVIVARRTPIAPLRLRLRNNSGETGESFCNAACVNRIGPMSCPAGRMAEGALQQRCRLPLSPRAPRALAPCTDGCPRRPQRGEGSHSPGSAADRVRHAVAGVHGLARQHHPGERAAHHRARFRRQPQPALADHDLSAGVDRGRAALRQDLRHPRAALHAADRDCDLHGGLAALRARAQHAGADPRTRAARARRRRARFHGRGRAGRRRRAEGARALLRLFRGDLHDRGRVRTGAGRLPFRVYPLVGDLLAQHPARDRGADRDQSCCCAGCRGTSVRTAST